jgi:RNA polymerase sigma-70 factor (ECF subfamily)
MLTPTRTTLAFDPSSPIDADARDLALARAGDERAFEALYRRHSTAVYRYAWLLTGSDSLANDVTQDTFVALLEGVDGYDPSRGSLVAYLCGVARFRAYRAYRSSDAAVDTVADTEQLAGRNDEYIPDLPLDALQRSRALARLYAAIRRLPTPYRDILMLVELQEMTYADAAAVAGIELGTVRSRLARARARLADLLRNDEP